MASLTRKVLAPSILALHRYIHAVCLDSDIAFLAQGMQRLCRNIYMYTCTSLSIIYIYIYIYIHLSLSIYIYIYLVAADSCHFCVWGKLISPRSDFAHSWGKEKYQGPGFEQIQQASSSRDIRWPYFDLQGPGLGTANLRSNIMDFRGFDSSIILI